MFINNRAGQSTIACSKSLINFCKFIQKPDEICIQFHPPNTSSIGSGECLWAFFQVLDQNHGDLNVVVVCLIYFKLNIWPLRVKLEKHFFVLFLPRQAPRVSRHFFRKRSSLDCIPRASLMDMR